MENNTEPMLDKLSIRSYSTKPTSHSHDYYQLVLPLRGVISLNVGHFDGKVMPGECVVIRENQEHLFTADPEARFVVADMQTLPANIDSFEGVVFAIKKSLSNYLNFVEEQLGQQINKVLEKSMYDTFYLLLADQVLLPKLDARISRSIMFIEQNIQNTLNIDLLAQQAHLSHSQFKMLFKKQTGMTVMSYVTKVRMEKAQALLMHTDYSLQSIGEMIGYNEQSTFSRKFSQYFGLSPAKFKK
jgi:AraC-like DNA-binding protein